MREGANQRLESSKVRGDWQGKRTFSGEIVENWRVALSLSHFAVAVGNEEEVMLHP